MYLLFKTVGAVVSHPLVTTVDVGYPLFADEAHLSSILHHVTDLKHAQHSRHVCRSVKMLKKPDTVLYSSAAEVSMSSLS